MGSAVNSPAPRAKPPLAALRRLLAALGLLLLGAGTGSVGLGRTGAQLCARADAGPFPSRRDFHEEGFASWACVVQRREG